MAWELGKASWVLVAVFVGSWVIGGCTSSSQIVSRRLIEHRALVDLHGLKPLQTYEPVDVQAAVPESWQEMKIKRTALFTDMQWKSPSGTTGVGMAKVKLPLPLSAKMVIWFAQREYSKRYEDSRIIDQWTDEAGREWFEAENSTYHVRGCAMTRGFDAWFMYFGYKNERIPDGNELSVAARSLETMVPTPFVAAPPEASASAE